LTRRGSVLAGSLSSGKNPNQEKSPSNKIPIRQKIPPVPFTVLPRPYDCLPVAAVGRGGGRGATAPFLMYETFFLTDN
jgi:hypothetical protein